MTVDTTFHCSVIDIVDETYIALLLLADPDRERVTHYAASGTCFQATNAQSRVGAAVWHPRSTTNVELLNLSVPTAMQGKGYGKQLLHALVAEARSRGFHTMTVGTGNSSLGALALYQKAGFRIDGVVKDYFLRHYSEAIVEHGIPCRDMIRLQCDLTE